MWLKEVYEYFTTNIFFFLFLVPLDGVTLIQFAQLTLTSAH